MLDCDNCKETFEAYSGYSIFVDEGTIKEQASQSGWEMNHKSGKCFCDKCHHYNDNDEFVLNEARRKPEEYILPTKDTGVNFGE